MSEPNYVLGIDYGTESGRVMLVDASNGEETAWHVVPYSNGVLDRELPGGGALGPDFALQDPLDYLTVLSEGVPAVLRSAGVDGGAVAGIGVDFTSCTVRPRCEATDGHNSHEEKSRTASAILSGCWKATNPCLSRISVSNQMLPLDPASPVMAASIVT